MSKCVPTLKAREANRFSQRQDGRCESRRVKKKRAVSRARREPRAAFGTRTSLFGDEQAEDGTTEQPRRTGVNGALQPTTKFNSCGRLYRGSLHRRQKKNRLRGRQLVSVHPSRYK
ncbi:hypothetical protein DBV15_10547 [Temnothorax longispinosus]|uniref:Uncharacterized protein n=1 Tax=Temnothorax longispinosus TaxID=300112 RepID=A0A4S2L1G3_9HYME|nr:hypothetical protein DBV15_10547 [Temnothorax longispinosus]